VHEAAIEIVLAVHLDRGQQPGHGARGQDGGHDRPAAEPAGSGALDAGRDAVERQFQAGEVVGGQRVVQHVTQRLDRMQVGAGGAA
jgi:hypothetical protein